MSDRQNSKESQPPSHDADSNDVETSKSYYYDDSTGYETYHPEGDAEGEEEVEKGESPTES